MAKAKYEDYSEMIIDLHYKGKKATEIAKLLNANHDVDITDADESGIRSFLRRSLPNQNQQNEIQALEENDDLSQGKIKYLSSLLEEMEKQNSVLKREAVIEGKLLNNLENIKVEYEEVIEKYSILNDTLQETIMEIKEDNSRKKMHYMIAAGWILTMLFAMFAGYYIGRCYSRTAFHYILTLTALPVGIFIGMAISYGKKRINNKSLKKAHVHETCIRN